jgi:4-diphosphocytidyl-2-C-methyl-D-erythritol kinase
MICFPPAKINLGLNIIDKRADGFHNIETIMYPIDLCDILEIIPAPGKRFSFKSTGLNIDGPDSSNLCIRAYQILKDAYHIPPVKMHLHKVIPMGAGMGGGSADATYTLMTLNEVFGLQLKYKMLREFAMQLGSDCPFFLLKRFCYASGRGNLLEDVAIDLAGKHVVIVKPEVSVSTAWAYSKFRGKCKNLNPATAVLQPMATWKEGLINDFEAIVFKKFPAIARIKEQLYAAGAIYASMSGSGSAVYGIYNVPPPQMASAFPDAFVWHGILKGR